MCSDYQQRLYVLLPDAAYKYFSFLSASFGTITATNFLCLFNNNGMYECRASFPLAGSWAANWMLQQHKDTVPSWKEDFVANHFSHNAPHRP